MNEIAPEIVRAHLSRVLTSESFSSADRLCRFLRFTIDAKLSGKHDQIKEYILGREVFDRKDNYDPRLDPIVRVEARRLRAKLAEYYAGPGQAEAIRIEYPKGSYVPQFEPAELDPIIPTNRPPLSKMRIWLTPVCVFVMLAAAIAAYHFSTGPVQGEMYAVMPVRWVWPENASLDKTDEPLAEAIDGELANRRIVRVLAWPLLTHYAKEPKPLREMARELGAGKFILVSVRGSDQTRRVTIFLVEAASGEKMSAGEYFPGDLSTLESQRKLARDIAKDLALKLKSGGRR